MKVSNKQIISLLTLFIVTFLFARATLAQQVSPEIPITLAENKQHFPTAAYDSVNNRHLIVFKTQRHDGQYDYDDVHGQLIKADGSVYGNIFPVSISGVDSINGELIYPASGEASFSVAFDFLSRKYLIAYSDRSGNPKLVGQLLDADGKKVDNLFLIGSGLSSGARVTYDSVERRFLVVWSSENRINGQLVDPHGVLIGNAFPISSLTGRVQIDPSVVFDPPNHQFLIIWREMYDEARSGASSLHGQRVNSDGSLQGIELILSSEINSHLFSVGIDHQTGKFLVLWNKGAPSIPGHSSDILGQFFNSDGAFSGLPFLVSTSIGAAGQGTPSVVYDASQRLFLAVWESDRVATSSATIAGQVIYPSGELWGSNFSVTQSGLQDLATPSMSLNTLDDDILLVWGGRTSEDEGDIWGAFLTLPTNNSLSLNSSVPTLNTESALADNPPSLNIAGGSTIIWEAGTYTYKDVLITENSTLIFNGAVTLNATTLTIDPGSAISADGRGYPAGQGPGAGVTGQAGSGGAGYGGTGGDGYKAAGGTIYGSATTPEELGSGGGGGSNGGAGGGAIKLAVNTLVINGSIRANGAKGVGYEGFGGSGSGGSIYIIAQSLTGSGSISANGGAYNSWRGGRGGGGRIAIYYQTSSFTGQVEAKVGDNGNSGENGTVGFFDTVNNDFYAGHSWRFQENDGPFNFRRVILNNSQVTTQGNIRLTANELIIGNHSKFTLGGDTTVVEVDKVTLQSNSSFILTGTSRLVTNSVALDGTSSVTTAGAENIATPSIRIAGGSTITWAPGAYQYDSVLITENSTLIFNGAVTLNATTLTIDPGSAISADGRGYPAGQGPGAGVTGQAGSGGAGYGGTGGDGYKAAGGTIYGSATTPEELGSGGGGGSNGGAGGGAIKLAVNTLVINGSIRANGAKGVGYEGFGGSGSGGSIYIIAQSLTGSGSISANGGAYNSWRGGRGGGGRIAIYYQTSSFTGQVEAKVGDNGNSGENGTVVRNPSFEEAPVSLSSLSEKSFSESNFTEIISSKKGIIENVTVSGQLNGTLNFASFEMISVQTGSFAGKGFSTGRWEANLEGVPYKGNWQGVLYLKEAEKRIYLNGIISGEVSGIVEGYLVESTPESNIYDKYQATWRFNRVGTRTTSGKINLNGTVSYQTTTEYPSTQLYVLQSSIEGTAFGHYTGPLSTVLTHVRVAGGTNPYDGEGFSFITYVSDSGQGEGWTYDRLVAPDKVELKGMFGSPLLGTVNATLNEAEISRSLLVTIERLGLGLPPGPDLKVVTWGPSRVSPGQTIDYIIEVRNDGIKAAENVTVIDELPWQVSHVSNTGEGTYKETSREVVWNLGSLGARSKTLLTTKGEVVGGLEGHTFFENIVHIPKMETAVEVDPTIEESYEVLEANQNYGKTDITFSTSSERGVINTELNITEVPKKIEPALEITESNNWTEVILRLLVQANSENQIEIKQKFTDKARDLLEKYENYKDLRTAQKKRQDFLNWLWGKGYISETNYKMFTSKNSGGFWTKFIINNFNFMEKWAEKAGFDKFLAPQIAKYFTKSADAAIDGFIHIYNPQQLDAAIRFEWAYRFPRGLDGPSSLSEAKEMYLKEKSFDMGTHTNEVITAHDPNIKYGPEGNVSPGEKLDYKVEYENEGEGIAFGVYFTDTLDQDLNDSTLVIGPVIDIQTGAQIARPGTYNPQTRTITWFVGEVGPGHGGYAELSANVRGDAPKGTEVINFATVYFPSVPEVTRTNGIVSIVGLDTTPPTITASVSQAPNAAGWNNTNVTVTLTAQDEVGGTGVKEISYSLNGAQTGGNAVAGSNVSVTISAEGTTTLTYFAKDNAGNQEAPKSLTIRVDKTPPMVTASRTPNPNASGWSNTDVVVSFNCSDGLSGVESCSAPMVLTAERAGQSATGTAEDKAGNKATVMVSGINIDKTPPVISGLPVPGCTIWPPNHRLVQVATVTASDALSGLTAASPAVVGVSNEPESGLGDGDIASDIVITGGTVQLRAERSGTGTGRIYTLTATASDLAGNPATARATCMVPHDQRQK
ncbi:hypothetical protein [Candidatus Methylomirabilis sp.]|uniref:OmpL47-type beta-barrel domain-containing protein n=1 Tax=Candidatus Methylomirabilis sp. TaxID=2032687 RepID=UPI002A673983|nr:hypothetical protein [Candidatus Methylomirabilis sp.]